MARAEQIVFSDGDTLRLNMSMTQSAFSKSRLSERIADEGLLAEKTGGTWVFTPWRFTGTHLEQEGLRENVFFEGSAFSGRTLHDILSDDGDAAPGTVTEDAGEHVLHVIEALEEALAQGQNVPNVGAGGMFLSEGEASPRILLVPEHLFTLAASCLGPSREGELNGRFVRNDLTGAAAVHYTQSVLAYLLVTGSLPFAEADSAKRHEDIMDANFLPLSLASPSCPEKLSFFVDNALRRKAKAAVHKKSSSAKRRSLSESIASQIREDTPAKAAKGTLRFPTDELAAFTRNADRSSICKELQEASGSRQWKSFRSALTAKRWFRRHRTVLSVAAVAVLAVTFFALTYWHGQQANPTTLGMDSREVTEFFYSAYNSLDIVAVQESTGGKQMGKVTDMLSGFYVSAKSRETYSGSGKTYPPAEWLWRTKGTLYSMYGLTHISIDGQAASLYAESPRKRDKPKPLVQEDGRTLTKGDTATHTVRFYFVYNEGEEELHVLDHTDTVTLTYTGKKWLLTGIQEDVRETVLVMAGFRQDFLSALGAHDGDVLRTVQALSGAYPWLSTKQELDEAREALRKSDMEIAGYTDL